MARPQKEETEKLSKTIAFRLTEADYQAYHVKFKASGMTQSDFFREHVLTNTTTVVARPVQTSESKRAVFLLQKASNNINQLAHRANADNLSGFLSDNTFSKILHQLDRLNRFLISQVEETKK